MGAKNPQTSWFSLPASRRGEKILQGFAALLGHETLHPNGKKKAEADYEY
jgi:hypothetical protein